MKALFNSLTLTSGAPAGHDPQGREHTLQLATGVLLIEMMRADAECTEHEKRAVVGALRDKFTLADDEVARLFELATTTSRDAPDLFTFTSQLNRGFSLEQKVRMVEYLWQVAFADGVLSHHENQLMLKLGDLLYIPRAEFVAAKQRARDGENSSAPKLHS
ncbi:MAG: TerB family tellurite resistance protein [Azoarcus sp.]|nr:TerB family tellurite resistance protein [Azoarcus sp.]